jgi:hypothetical protein
MLVATFVAPIFIPLFFSLLARKPRPEHGEHHALVHHVEPDEVLDEDRGPTADGGARPGAGQGRPE